MTSDKDPDAWAGRVGRVSTGKQAAHTASCSLDATADYTAE